MSIGESLPSLSPAFEQIFLQFRQPFHLFAEILLEDCVKIGEESGRRKGPPHEDGDGNALSSFPLSLSFHRGKKQGLYPEIKGLFRQVCMAFHLNLENGRNKGGFRRLHHPVCYREGNVDLAVAGQPRPIGSARKHVGQAWILNHGREIDATDHAIFESEGSFSVEAFPNGLAAVTTRIYPSIQGEEAFYEILFENIPDHGPDSNSAGFALYLCV